MVVHIQAQVRLSLALVHILVLALSQVLALSPVQVLSLALAVALANNLFPLCPAMLTLMAGQRFTYNPIQNVYRC